MVYDTRLTSSRIACHLAKIVRVINIDIFGINLVQERTAWWSIQEWIFLPADLVKRGLFDP
jgi:hypothetical protein